MWNQEEVWGKGGEKKRAALSSTVICTWKALRGKNTSLWRNVSEPSWRCRDLSNYTRCPYLVPAWRQGQNLYLQNEVSNSLHNPPFKRTPAPAMFPPISQKVLSYGHMLLNLKKEKLPLDKIQQLSSNSWEHTVAGITLGPRESSNRCAWKKATWTW